MMGMMGMRGGMGMMGGGMGMRGGMGQQGMQGMQGQNGQMQPYIPPKPKIPMVDEEKVKEKLRACWNSGTKLTLGATLATLSIGWYDRHVQAPRSYQLLKLNAKRKTPFPKTDRAYAKLRERLQSGIDIKVALLSEFWKRWTLNRLHSLVDSIDPRWGIRPGKRFQRFCYAMSDVHSIEIRDCHPE